MTGYDRGAVPLTPMPRAFRAATIGSGHAPSYRSFRSPQNSSKKFLNTIKAAPFPHDQELNAAILSRLIPSNRLLARDDNVSQRNRNGQRQLYRRAQPDASGILDPNVTLTNIQISADLTADGGLPTSTVYLTNALWPGTTSAVNQVAINASAPFAAGATPQFEILFPDLTLPPRTYYLVITGPGPNPSDNNSWEGASPVTLITAPGVTYGSVSQSSGTGETEVGYLPSASFTNLGNDFTLQFIVSDSSVAPEPASWLPAAAGLLALCALKLKRRSHSHAH